jgi:D-alanine--poly(phosphoribitol) ligase subunit 2
MAATLDEVQRALGEHIEQEILLRKAALTPEEDLFAAGFDSLSLSRVLVFVEQRFGVTIPDEDVVVDEVSTLATMARFVHARIQSAKA